MSAQKSGLIAFDMEEEEGQGLATRLFATYQFFNFLVPSVTIFIHLLVVAIWVGPIECKDMAPVYDPFFIYWTIMIIFTFFLALIGHMRVQHPQINRVVYVCVSTLISTLLFVMISFIRAKPFKCMEGNGRWLAYLFGPVGFTIVFVLGLSFAALLAFTFRYNEIVGYQRIGVVDGSEDMEEDNNSEKSSKDFD